MTPLGAGSRCRGARSRCRGVESGLEVSETQFSHLLLKCSPRPSI